MGCDIGTSKEHIPYCQPLCKEFKLIPFEHIDIVKAQCIRCSLQHDVTIVDGQIKVHQGTNRPVLPWK